MSIRPYIEDPRSEAERTGDERVLKEFLPKPENLCAICGKALKEKDRSPLNPGIHRKCQPRPLK